MPSFFLKLCNRLVLVFQCLSSCLIPHISETPAGEAGSGRPRRRECAEEAPGPPAESVDMCGIKKRTLTDSKN